MSVKRREDHADVVIVGMGPTGATLGCLLGRLGVHTTVLDRLTDLFPYPRAAGIDHEALRILQRAVGRDQLLELIAPYRPSVYRGVDGEPIKRLESIPEPYLQGWTPNCVFDQPALERLLRSRLTWLPTIEARTGVEVTGVRQEGPEGACVTRGFDINSGAPWLIHSRFVVACDGASSPTRKALGAALEDHGFHQRWLVVDAEVTEDAAERLPQTQVQYCTPERPTTFVVLKGRLRRWELRVSDDEFPTTTVADHQVWPYLEPWVSSDDARLVRAAAYTFHAMTAKRWHRGNIMLAGDAAHMTPPFMAQGMVQGIRDAGNLAWKLHAALRGTTHTDRILSTYEQERRPHAIATTARAVELGRIIAEPDPEIARTRDQHLRAAHGGTVRPEVRQNLIPPLTNGSFVSRSRYAGTPFPQPRIADQGRELWFDDAVGNGFILVAAHATGADLMSLQALSARISGCELCVLEQNGAHHSPRGVQIFQEKSGDTLAWMREHGIRFAVVRPDKYIYADAADIVTLEEHVDVLVNELGTER